MDKTLILIGGGGHCESSIDVIEQQGEYTIAGIVDIPRKIGNSIAGYEIIADDTAIPDLAKEYDCFFITLGQINSPEKRIKFFNLLLSLNVKLPIIISPLAYVSKNVSLGPGTIIHHHALINAGAKIGNNCIINTKALVEHNAIVEDHVHISTNAIINGGSYVGMGTFVGSATMVRESVRIGERCIIGAGLKVMHSVKTGDKLKISQ
ncbi:NeuD/PglB/VioB family sugar acetyltransferase [Desulfobacterales bacterium HSG17]|nr:NeuD/PglB/VioB family sugar acetyltransferase [Desulfobacterales bacterium HSG17]